ncbi:MAG: hypothetical protein ACRC46_12890 [Thermoguttaceae bacterium]
MPNRCAGASFRTGLLLPLPAAKIAQSPKSFLLHFSAKKDLSHQSAKSIGSIDVYSALVEFVCPAVYDDSTVP